MDHLLHYIVKEKAYTNNSGTIYLDLPKDAKISQLMIEANLKRSATVDPTNSILLCIEKIHVLLDGAKVGYTMQPEVGSFDYLLRAGKEAPHELSALTGDRTFMNLPILFGRYPGDLEYGLDTGQYGSAAVEIEYTVDTTDFATGTLVITAWILVPVEPVSYRGLVRARIIEDKVTPTAGAVHTVDFPSTYPLLAAFCRIYDYDKWCIENVTDLDFQADQGRYRIFDGRIEDLVALQAEILGKHLPSPHILGDSNNSTWVRTFMGQQHDVSIHLYGTVDYTINVGSLRGHAFWFFTDGAPARLFYHSYGTMPWGCLILGDWRDDPFDAPAHADLKCDYLIGATTPETLTTCVLEVVDGVL